MTPPCNKVSGRAEFHLCREVHDQVEDAEQYLHRNEEHILHQEEHGQDQVTEEDMLKFGLVVGDEDRDQHVHEHVQLPDHDKEQREQAKRQR